MVRITSAFLVAAVAFSTVSPVIAAPYGGPQVAAPLRRDVTYIQDRAISPKIAGGLAGVLSGVGVTTFFDKLFGKPARRELDDRGFFDDEFAKIMQKLFGNVVHRREFDSELEARGFFSDEFTKIMDKLFGNAVHRREFDNELEARGFFSDEFTKIMEKLFGNAVQRREFSSELEARGFFSDEFTKIMDKLFGQTLHRRDLEDRAFTTSVAGGLAGVFSNIGIKKILNKLFGTPPPRRELEDRAISPKIAGALAGVLSGFSVKELSHDLFGTPSPRHEEIEDRSFTTLKLIQEFDSRDLAGDDIMA